MEATTRYWIDPHDPVTDVSVSTPNRVTTLADSSQAAQEYHLVDDVE